MKIASFNQSASGGAFLVTLLTVATLITLTGCAPRPPKKYISGNFVPAGMQYVKNTGAAANDPRGMSKGDPNVPASVKAHTITGLPPGNAQGGPPPGVITRP